MTTEQATIVIRMLQLTETDSIGTIDRSEPIAEIYRISKEKLELTAAPEWVAGFDPEELEAMIKRQKDILRRGGAVLGAFEGSVLAGVASVDPKMIAGTFCKMDILYVSRPYRGRGLGIQLLQACKKEAKAYGATGMYISATPTRGTVDFYRGQGARLLDRPDPELLRMEPDDIHLGLEF